MESHPGITTAREESKSKAWKAINEGTQDRVEEEEAPKRKDVTVKAEVIKASAKVKKAK